MSGDRYILGNIKSFISRTGFPSFRDEWFMKYFRLQNKVDTLFDAIKHGDEEHQKWLKNKIEEHFKT